MSGGQHDADEVVRSAETSADASIVAALVEAVHWQLPEDRIVQVVQSTDTSALCDLQAAGKALSRESAELKKVVKHYEQVVQLVYKDEALQSRCKALSKNKVEAAEIKDKMTRVAANFAEVSASMDKMVMQDAKSKAKVASHDAEVLSHCQALEARPGSWEHSASFIPSMIPRLLRTRFSFWELTAKYWELTAELSLVIAKQNTALEQLALRTALRGGRGGPATLGRLVPCKSKAATFSRKAATMEATEAEAKAVVMAEVEAKANAAADALLAEEAAEKAAAAGKARGKPKDKGKSSGNAAKAALRRLEQALPRLQGLERDLREVNRSAASNKRAAERAAGREVHARRRVLQKAFSGFRLVIAQARADAKATAVNAAAAAKQRVVREQAEAAEAAKVEPGYTPAGPSYKASAVAWGEEAPDARDKAKRLAAKEASIEAAKKAEAEKKAEEARKTAERLEQCRNIRIGEAIASGK